MSRAMKTVPLVVLCALIIDVPSVWASWVPNGLALTALTAGKMYAATVSDGAGGAIVTWQDYTSGTDVIFAQRLNASGSLSWTPAIGVRLCGPTGTHQLPQITSDGAGGAIVAWEMYSSNVYAVFAQRVNASGAVQWAENGVQLSIITGNRVPTIVSDGAGGAIVTWQDSRSGTSWDIYAQRVNASGVVQWTANGVALSTATGDQQLPQIASDGAGGAIVTWTDYRSGVDLYAQRVNASGVVQWTASGVALCTATGNQVRPTIASDSAGGAIVTWQDSRSGNYDIYAQRVNASGAVQWTVNGAGLCTATGDQAIPTIVSDGAGGAIVTWYDYRSVSYADIYTQRVDASGAIQWTVGGVPLCTATGSQYYPTIVSDGAGGAIVTWQDGRNGDWDVYVQKVNASGVVQWMADGVALCTATGDQAYPVITSDGAGGAIATWWDGRGGGEVIYAQYVDAHGGVGLLAPGILSVEDVPHDQGGRVRIIIEPSRLDVVQERTYPVSIYNVWQRIDDLALVAMVARRSTDAAPGGRTIEASMKRSVDELEVAGWAVKESSGRYFVQSNKLLGTAPFPTGTWELVGSFAASQEDQYVYRLSTLADSTASGIPHSVYIVSAHTTTPSLWYASEPDSGYSVDNIAPGTPKALAGKQSFTPVGLNMTWDHNTEADLAHYAVYRGTNAGFVPGPSNLIASPTDTAIFDSSWRWSGGYYYKVAAVDRHGNESGFALLTPDDVAGSETPKAPAASYLAQNFPNPFNPMTRIEFGLSVPGRVSLRIYDAPGRLVRMLVEGTRPAANYAEVWDGRDAGGRAVASGIYFCRLDAGSFTQTRKMILLR